MNSNSGTAAASQIVACSRRSVLLGAASLLSANGIDVTRAL